MALVVNVIELDKSYCDTISEASAPKPWNENGQLARDGSCSQRPGMSVSLALLTDCPKLLWTSGKSSREKNRSASFAAWDNVL